MMSSKRQRLCDSLIHNFFFLKILILILCFVEPCQAKLLVDLYQSATLVKDQTEYSREQAIRKALQQVLVKVSGKAEWAASSVLVDKLDVENATRFVMRYYYEKVESALPDASKIKSNPIGITTASSVFPYKLYVAFSPQRVNQFLESINQTVWGQERPVVMSLIVIQERRLTRVQQDSLFAHQLVQWANRLGIPMIMLAHQSFISNMQTARSIWSESIDWAVSLARRHNADYVLLGRIRQNGRKDHRSSDSDWLLIPVAQRKEDTILRWNINFKNQRDIVIFVMQKLASQLARQDAVLLSQQVQHYKLTIRGIHSLEDYHVISNFLKNLNIIKYLRLETLRGTQSSFRIAVLGDIANLRRIIEHEKFLRPSTSVTDGTQDDDLVYDYQHQSE